MLQSKDAPGITELMYEKIIQKYLLDKYRLGGTGRDARHREEAATGPRRYNTGETFIRQSKITDELNTNIYLIKRTNKIKNI